MSSLQDFVKREKTRRTLDLRRLVVICDPKGKSVRLALFLPVLLGIVHTVERIRIRPMATKHDDGTVLVRQEQKLKPPSMYEVLLLNDDYTPMEFVVMVLQEYFNKDRENATQIMLMVHRDGKGVCGLYPKDIASTKVELVMNHARKAGHPLQCVMEEV